MKSECRRNLARNLPRKCGKKMGGQEQGRKGWTYNGPIGVALLLAHVQNFVERNPVCQNGCRRFENISERNLQLVHCIA